jgi:hypothetical protein
LHAVHYKKNVHSPHSKDIFSTLGNLTRCGHLSKQMANSRCQAFRAMTWLATVWPQPILKKVRTWWQIPPQHQSTYLGGPESASIEIPPFRRFFSKIKIFKNFPITPKLFFALQYMKNWTKVVPWKKKFCSWKKNLLV